MVFSSFTFLFAFLPVFLVVYYLSPNKLRNLVALVFSYIFYAWGAPKIVGLLFLGSLVDYLVSRGFSHKKKLYAKSLFSFGVFFNIALLAYFKYANFFVEEASKLLLAFGFQGVSWTEVVLPIGISFFTFQKISYLIDVYRKDVPPASSLVGYLLYVASFPQLIAGPIVRYRDVNKQIQSRVHSTELAFEGAYRFSVGLAKKVLIADPMGAVAENVFSLSSTQLSPGYAWLGIVCYAYQIYFDFSGYSDMAIGLGKMIGFNFLENFNYPYISENFTDFWRRWHISLSRWMRDYLYIPLGGNQGSSLRTYVNLWIVFLLSGLWHGASMTFVFWGAFHGLFLTLDKLFLQNLSKRLHKSVNILITFALVCIGWVFFRFENFGEALSYLGAMFDITKLGTPSDLIRANIIHNHAIFIFCLATIFSFSPAFGGVSSLREKLRAFLGERNTQFIRFASCSAIIILVSMSLASVKFAPFIYFRF